MKKPIVVIPAVINHAIGNKYGGWGWMEYSKKAWKYWCDKNGYELVIYDECKITDLVKYRVTVQRWFDIHDFLEERGVEYSKVLMVDACSIPHWDCPDFFKLTGDNMCGMYDMDNLGWVNESIEGYKHMFDNFNLNPTKYMNSGWVIFNKSHKQLFKQFEEYYLSNFEEFYKLQTKTVQRGTCQTPLNYFIQMNNVKVDFLPQMYRLSHMHRKECFRNNWQMDNTEYEDKTPWFVKYGYIWVFSGFGKEHRNKLMEQTWKMLGHMYE